MLARGVRGEVGFAPDSVRAGERSGVGTVRIGGGEIWLH